MINYDDLVKLNGKIVLVKSNSEPQYEKHIVKSFKNNSIKPLHPFAVQLIDITGASWNIDNQQELNTLINKFGLDIKMV